MMVLVLVATLLTPLFRPKNLADSPLSAVPLLLLSTLKVFAPIQDP